MAVQASLNLIPRRELMGVAFFVVIGVALIALAPAKQPVESYRRPLHRLAVFDTAAQNWRARGSDIRNLEQVDRECIIVGNYHARSITCRNRLPA